MVKVLEITEYINFRKLHYAVFEFDPLKVHEYTLVKVLDRYLMICSTVEALCIALHLPDTYKLLRSHGSSMFRNSSIQWDDEYLTVEDDLEVLKQVADIYAITKIACNPKHFFSGAKLALIQLSQIEQITELILTIDCERIDSFEIHLPHLTYLQIRNENDCKHYERDCISVELLRGTEKLDHLVITNMVIKDVPIFQYIASGQILFKVLNNVTIPDYDADHELLDVSLWKRERFVMDLESGPVVVWKVSGQSCFKCRSDWKSDLKLLPKNLLNRMN